MPFIIKDDIAYIALEPSAWSREKSNLELSISLARQKIKQINAQMSLMDEGDEDYDELQDQKNDLEYLIDDCNNRFEILLRAGEALKPNGK